MWKICGKHMERYEKLMKTHEKCVKECGNQRENTWNAKGKHMESTG
jgi:hypothetical protein